MSAPNIVNPTTINGKNYEATPSVNTAVVAVSNAAASGHVYKIEQIIACNNTTSAATASVMIYSSEGTPGSAPAGGAYSSMATAISVPANSSLIVNDRSTSFWLEENKSVVVQCGTSSAMTFSIGYEDMV